MTQATREGEAVTERLLVVSTGHGRVGLTSVTLGLVRALQRYQVRVVFAKPIAQPSPGYAGPERSTALAQEFTSVCIPVPITLEHAQALIADGQEQTLMEEVVELFQTNPCDGDVVVIEGLVPTDHVYATQINLAMARALNARIVIVGRVKNDTPQESAKAVELAARAYGVLDDALLGVVLNKVPTIPRSSYRAVENLFSETAGRPIDQNYAVPFQEALARDGIRCLGLVPFEPRLVAPRVKELAEALSARILRKGQMNRRVRNVSVAAMTVPYALERGMKTGNLIIVPGDRVDNIVAACLAVLNGIRLAAIVLTGGIEPDAHVLEICEPAFATGLPLLMCDADTFPTAQAAIAMDVEVPIDDRERADLVMNTVANSLKIDQLQTLLSKKREQLISPPAFRHMLIERARAANKRIVLPEGDEPRTLTAATICSSRRIARCVLLGDPDTINAVARREGIDLHDAIEILDPKEQVPKYIDPLVDLRRDKGVHPAMAEDMLQDNVWLGTMMLKLGHVDGLVSGAVHTTANTIRPALQIIKMAPGYALVSSVFFMCLPEQVLVYGDCAVNPDPNVEQLADIAIQSAESAEAFGIPPRVAMISYSTGDSGAGADVEKVSKATELARERRSDLLIDGPLQYDAALVESVGKTKAPASVVAGRATVFVFPDLNTGNTVYKAVQRSANVVSIGPMLQGMAKPVNDLSRGALVEDIVFTIALTAIQAEQVTKRETQHNLKTVKG